MRERDGQRPREEEEEQRERERESKNEGLGRKWNEMKERKKRRTVVVRSQLFGSLLLLLSELISRALLIYACIYCRSPTFQNNYVVFSLSLYARLWVACVELFGLLLFRQKKMFRVLNDSTHPKLDFWQIFCLITSRPRTLILQNSLWIAWVNILSLPFVTPRAHDIETRRERKRSLTFSLCSSSSSSVFCRVENKFFCVV